MRRTIYLPLALVLAAAGVVAMVNAQEWNPWKQPAQNSMPQMIHNPTVGPAVQLPQNNSALPAFRQPNRTNSAMGSLAPNHFAPAAEGKLPVPRPVDDPWLHAHSQLPAPQSEGFAEPVRRETFSPSLPPLRVDNPFVSRPTNPIRQVQAIAGEGTSEAIAPNVAAVKETAAKETTPTQLAAPAQQTITVPAAITKVELTDGPTSSRRSKSFSEPALRVAEREIRPPSPAILPTTAPTTVPATPTQPSEQPLAQKPATTESVESVLFAAEAPVLSVRTAGPPTIVVGKAASYTIEIANTGAAEADNVTVMIDLPQWTEVAATDASSGTARVESGAGQSGRVKWTIDQLSANQRERLTLRFIPRQSKAIDLTVNWSCAPRSGTAQIEVQEPKLELLVAGPPEVLYGETKTYTITVSNPGSGPAENVTLQLLPVTSGQESGGESKLGAIEPGGRRVIEIELTARQQGEIELRVQAFGDGGLRSEAAQAIQVRRGALEATIAGPPLKYAGTTAVYQLRVANTGDAPASDVVAEAALPRGAAFIAASEGGTLRADQARVQWQIGALRPGAARVFELRCKLAEAGSNRVEFVAAGSDELSAATRCVTRVEALADLKLEINDPPGPVPAGEPLVYQVTLVNRGTKDAEHVQISAMFSEGIEPLAVEGAAAQLHVGLVEFQTIERVAAGQQLTLNITAKAQVEGNHTFRVQVTCADPQTQLAAQETTQFYGNGGAEASQPTPALSPAPAEASLPPRFDPRE